MKWMQFLELPPHPTHDVNRGEYDCPSGTEPRGKAPPTSLTQACVKLSEGGREILHGPSLTWWGSGKKESQGEYREGKRHGLWFFWHADRTPKAKGRYQAGVRQGEWRFYDPEEGLTRHTFATFKEGVLHGQWQRSRLESSGKDPRSFEYVGWYKDGRQHGTWSYFDDHGHQYEQLEFVAGRVHGPAMYWHSSGNKAEEGQYRFGVRDGEWTEWDDRVVRRRVGRYQDGKKHGPWQEFDAGDQLRKTRIYEFGGVVQVVEPGELPSQEPDAELPSG